MAYNYYGLVWLNGVFSSQSTLFQANLPEIKPHQTASSHDKPKNFIPLFPDAHFSLGLNPSMLPSLKLPGVPIRRFILALPGDGRPICDEAGEVAFQSAGVGLGSLRLGVYICQPLVQYYPKLPYTNGYACLCHFQNMITVDVCTCTSLQ